MSLAFGRRSLSLMATMHTLQATVVRGHGVASGVARDPRFPAGTLQMQFPFFAKHGLQLGGFFPGTINLDISPASYRILQPKQTIADLRWHPDCPPETFSFFDCRIDGEAALIYYPHPETKPEHFQSPSVLEILAPELEGIRYGKRVQLSTKPQQIEFHLPAAPED